MPRLFGCIIFGYLKEVNGRWTCQDCGYEYSGMMGDNEVPEFCEACCDNDDYGHGLVDGLKEEEV